MVDIIEKKKTRFDLLKKTLRSIKLTLFAYYKPKQHSLDTKKEFEAYFGSKRVLECLNRLETRTMTVNRKILNHLCDIVLENDQNWFEAENLIGAHLNQIKM